MTLILSGTDGLSDVDGSAATPAIRGTDANTGIFFPAADTIAFSEGGVESMRIDSSGNVGIGLSPFANSLSKSLDIVNGVGLFGSGNNTYLSANAYYDSAWKYKATDEAAFLGIESASFRFNIAASGTAGNAITFTEAMRLDASGRLLVGTTSDISAGGYFGAGQFRGSFPAIVISGTETSARTWQIGENAGSITFYDTTGGERARIDSSGNLLVGTTSNIGSTSILTAVQPSVTNLAVIGAQASSASYAYNILDLNTATASGTGFAFIKCRVSNYTTTVFQVLGNGNAQNANNSYGATSDIKVKENIVDASPKLADLLQVKIRNYNLKSDPAHKQIGVVAQELEEIFPSMIDELPDKDLEGNDLGTTTKAVKYSVFVPMLIKAIQEQQAIITALQADVAALKAPQGTP